MNKENKSSNAQNEILITPLEKGVILSLNQIISTAEDGSSIKFAQGEYPINETVRITKSIRLVGSGIDQTIITGSGLPLLVETCSDLNIELEGISFVAISEKPTTAVKMDSGILKVRTCSFSGGVSDEEDDKYGTGLYVGGNSEIEISQSRFEENQNSGLRIDGKAQGVVIKNEFRKNDSGLAVTGNTSIDALENYFTENHVGVAYDHSAKGPIKENTFVENRAGILVKGNSTTSIINNKFNKNDIGIGLAENCDVLIEGNEIKEGQLGLKFRHKAKAVICKNQIQGNQLGISCTDSSTTEILNNVILHHEKFGILVENESTTYIDANTINENAAALKFDHLAKFKVENNQIIGNSLYGILAKSKSKGAIHRNIIKKNVHWNVDVREEADVDFDDFKEPVPQGKSAKYSVVENQLLVYAPDVHERIFFTELFSKAKPGQVIVLENGKYNLSNLILIDKPLKLIAKTSGEVSITGEGLPNLLVYTGEGKLTLSGIKFSLENPNQTNVIMIKTGHLDMDQCIVEGGKDPKKIKRDFGAGLILLGASTATISNSIFEKNIMGISVQDQASVTLESNKFTENGYGIVLRDKSNSNMSENEYYSNTAYGFMAYDHSVSVISGETCHNNKAGFGFIEKAKAAIENSKSFENEYHGFFIDNNADCMLKKNQSFSNSMSGIAGYGDSQTLMEENEVFDNRNGGFEIADNARSILKNNKIHGNPKGIYLGNSAAVNIELNEIYENETGIYIDDVATANIVNNKIYQNSGEGIHDSSDNESTIGENEILKNGDENEGNEGEEGDSNLGDLFAQMFDSENLSNDPNAAAIPLGKIIESSGDNNEVVTMDQINSFFSSMSNDPVQKYYSLIGDGEELLSQGKIGEAQVAFLKAIEFNQNDPTAYVILSGISYSLADMQGTINYLKNAIDVESFPMDLCFLRGSLLQMMEKDDEALLDFLKAIDARLDVNFDRIVLSRIHSENNQLEIAVRKLVNNIRIDASDARNSLIKGALTIIASRDLFYQKGEDFEEPLDLFTRAIQLEPDKATYYWCRGFVQESYEQKIDDYSQGVRLKGDNAESYYIRGYTKLLELDLQGARQDFSKVNELEPGNIEPYEKLGLYYLNRDKDFDQAIDVLTKAIEHNSINPNIFFYRGLAYEKQGDLESAISDFQKYIHLADNGGEFKVEKVKERIEIISKGEITFRNAASEYDENSIDLGKSVAGITEKSGNNNLAHQEKDDDNSISFSFTIDSNGNLVDNEKENESATAIVYHRRGVQNYLQKDYKVAVENFTKAIQLDPENIEDILYRGTAYAILENFDGVIEDYSTYLLMKSENADHPAYNALADALFAKEDWNLAISIFSKLIDKNPGFDNLYSMRGEAYTYIPNWDLALLDFNKVINIDPGCFDIYNQRGIVYENTGNITAAISDYQMYLELGGNNNDDKAEVENKILGLQKKIHSYEGAREKTVLIVEEKKMELAEEHMRKGVQFQKCSDFDKAISEYQLAINIAPNFALPYKAIFFIHAGKLDWEKAFPFISEVIRINPEDADAYYNRGAGYITTGKLDEAIKDCKAAILHNPDYILAYLGLGTAFLMKNDFENAVIYFGETIKRDSNNAKAFLYRANAYENMGKPRVAINDYQKYVDLGGGPDVSNLNDLKDYIKELRKR